MQQVAVRTYKVKPMTEETKDKVEKSYEESLDLQERELRCPHCGRYIMALYSDASGHLKHKCPACKNITVFNLGYFRRKKRYRKLPVYPVAAR